MLFITFRVILCLLGLVLGEVQSEATGISQVTLPSETTVQSLQNSYTRKQLAALTKRFTNYYLYFGEFANTVRDNGGLPVGVCFPTSYQNATHKLLATSLTTSVRKAFVNRVLSRDQISWKNKSDEKPKKVLPSGNTTLPNSADNSTTGSEASEAQKSEENEKNKNNKIHNHLIFVMLLPNHPYSQDLRRVMTTVSPMFPQAMVVLGNAYEFKDMTTKYYVTSYPKILYFRSGIYMESFEGAHTAEDVAAQMADWTYSLPRAVPVPFSHTKLAYRTANTVRKLDIHAPDGHMRLGLALHPLPLTVPYMLFNITVPGWLAAYLPASYIDSGNLSTTRLNSTNSELSAANSEVSKSQTVASDASTTENVKQSNTLTMELSTGIDGNSESTLTPQTDKESSIHTQEATPTSTHEDKPAITSNPLSQQAGTSQSQDISLQLSIVVPMPNVEPFLGSLENYAIWDTRMFLLAGLYVIIRVFYLLLKWVRSVRV